MRKIPAAELRQSGQLMPDKCPLCDSTDTVFMHEDGNRIYRNCGNCALIFVPKSQHLNRDEELAHYGTHQNNIHDPRYRTFLRPAFDAIEAHFSAPSSGLDFGCGPGPALVHMFREAGHNVVGFDPLFFPNVPLPEQHYDFITATEVAEHLRTPRDEFLRLWTLLRPGGMLLVMTKHVPDSQPFGSWYYRRDPTHIAFYRDATFRWIADFLTARLIRVSPDVVLLQKSDETT